MMYVSSIVKPKRPNIALASVGIRTDQEMSMLLGAVPSPFTLSGFLNGTSGCVLHTSECPDGEEGPILFHAITLWNNVNKGEY